MKTLKKLALVAISLLSVGLLSGFICVKTFTSSSSARNYNVDVTKYEIDGHTYILAVTYDTFVASPKLAISSTMIHAHSCPCINNIKEK